ncbi:glutathione S-transferase family protein [Tistrella bauzanensis]|uniref:Glutathione S-transferase family protein n=1 Tax=Tistrella arctica TaxID=3133430 RepID=A0ABU9YIF6_9PROT
MAKRSFIKPRPQPIGFHPGDTPDGGAVALALGAMRRPQVPVPAAARVIDPAAAAFMGDCPMGFRPPVVVIDGASHIIGARAALNALAAADERLMPRRQAEQAVARDWLDWIESDLVPPMLALLALRRFAPRHLPDAIDAARDVLRRHLLRVEDALADGPTLAGRWSAADMRLMAWMHRADWLGVGLASRPALSAFVDRGYARPQVVLALAGTRRPPNG